MPGSTRCARADPDAARAKERPAKASDAGHDSAAASGTKKKGRPKGDPLECFGPIDHVPGARLPSPPVTLTIDERRPAYVPPFGLTKHCTVPASMNRYGCPFGA